MVTQQVPPLLYPIAESPDLLADACLCDAQRQLVFLSLWGRDTAVQAFIGRLTLGAAEQGLTGFHLDTDSHGSLPIEIGNVDRLDKRNTREMRRTLFGTLNHFWLFDHRCIEPDRPNATAFALLGKSASNHRQRLWQLVSDTCPVPLLDNWRDTVLELLHERFMLTEFPIALGPVTGFRLSVDVPALTQALGDLIRAGTLTTEVTSEAVDCFRPSLKSAA